MEGYRLVQKITNVPVGLDAGPNLLKAEKTILLIKYSLDTVSYTHLDVYKRQSYGM